MDASFCLHRNLRIMGDEQEDELGCLSSSSSSGSTNSAASSSSDFVDDATSSCSNSPTSSSSDQHTGGSPLFEMSTLMADLPFKRGLSKHFQGKSQSFTSLSSVRCLEDLVKPERTCRKKTMKTCKSYAGGLDAHRPHSPKGAITKKPSKGSLSSLMGARRNGFLGGRPPIHPHSSCNLAAQTLLLA